MMRWQSFIIRIWSKVKPTSRRICSIIRRLFITTHHGHPIAIAMTYPDPKRVRVVEKCSKWPRIYIMKLPNKLCPLIGDTDQQWSVCPARCLHQNPAILCCSRKIVTTQLSNALGAVGSASACMRRTRPDHFSGNEMLPWQRPKSYGILNTECSQHTPHMRKRRSAHAAHEIASRSTVFHCQQTDK